MRDKYFFDTNIIVYSFDYQNTRKREIARMLIAEALENQNSSISYQVVQEFINVSTRKFKNPLSTHDCKEFIEQVLHPIWHVYPSKELMISALNFSERWNYSFYDSLIIASAIEVSATVLYTEDLQHGQKINTLQIINPFIKA